ncbi:cob(I)yrinic acid a,c-diamide adenosyltransferase [Halosquirtibacter xylanolyticus]|uniref:cob(I)yrinic acid a,c-diamide adenosyltransferase n=1 Tax=Halosquirtibacter xylanolyticus TaxID=3374599 RepID=UPI003749CD29|nr:cob(I)yrinic acid a,c-diamide adenosyltransferase [Prolixibacteraceae bacterium]
MRIYTKTGDHGETGIFGGDRVPKDDLRVETNGIIDEANSHIGYVRSLIGEAHPWQDNLYKIQRDLMLMMSHIATPANCKKENPKPHPEQGPAFCEEWIEALLEELQEEKDFFLLPGGDNISSNCHIVRTKIRTAERRLVTLLKAESKPLYILSYLNRLSDLFFVLARVQMKKAGIKPEKFALLRKKES